MSQSLYTMSDYVIPIRSYGKEITIIPFGDVHAFAPMWARDKFVKDCIEWSKMNDTYFVGMGDFLDLLSGSERRELDLKKAHESTEATLEDYYLKKTEEFCEMIKFMKGRLIGLVEGNHYIDFSFGGTSTTYMCQQLRCPYLGGAASVSLILEYKDRHRHLVEMFLHHGRSGGRMPSSSIAPLYHTANGFDADIILFGHDHNKSCDYINRLTKNRANGVAKLHSKKILIARTGTYLKSYEPGRVSYPVKSAMPPADLGSIKIKITPVRQQINGKDEKSVDLKCEL